MKELCRNDTYRTLKLEFFSLRQVKEVETAFYMAEFDFTLEDFKKHLNKYMNCFAGKSNVGKVKLVSMNVYKKMQFIDYIYGGCDISTMVAMDCTIGNGHPS